MLLVSASPFVSVSSADNIEEIEVLETVVNPNNNHTYHLLSPSSWSDAASVARSLGGFLVTVDDSDEDEWIFDTFAVDNDTTRHLWIGLSDHQSEGDFRWHDGTPFTYRNWGDGQPGDGDDEDYVHITGTNMGSIEPASWNDLEDDPQYFPVYGVVEIGEGADYALRFDGDDDHIMIDEEMPNWMGEIEIEAWVNLADDEGIQFITMYGDYGWGLYLNDGYLAYSNEYSLSKNPTSNTSIQTGVWTHVKVVVNSQTGGEFFIDNVSSGLIDVNKSQIPDGDFGSNDCFQSGEECDELYIGRMGAGCDCNYFYGLLDDVRIGNSYSESVWMFTEGEGDVTEDSQGLIGEIHGAAWVMPDGTIIAQAIELENGEYYYDISSNAGDTLLFFMEIPENTQYVTWSMYSYDYYYDEDYYEEQEYEIYISKDQIPSAWNHDYEVETYYGLYVYEYFEWPEEGVYWITVTSNVDIQELEISAYWEEAPEPPELDEMTELNDGIAVTNQRINRNSGDSLYFYVDLQEDLAELRVNTYDGRGDCELHIARGALPFVDDWGWIEDEYYMSESKSASGRNIGGQDSSDHSYGPGNDETVQIFDAQPGIYYVMMTTYSGCRDVTIKAEFTYNPDNVDPESAVQLTDGISYGPISGFEGLDQYFYIDVPVGTERLEVDLNNGDGEAKLMMRLEEYPTWTTYDQHSNAPGAGDKIGFNDPSPGTWYILVGSEEYYSRIDITASFEERYVWSYDGEPIQLFNDEEIGGISAPEGEELYFYIDLEDSSAMDLIIKTWGGTGDLVLYVETEEIDWEDFEGESWGRQFGESVYESNSGEADEEIDIFFASGRIDITIFPYEDIDEITIVATWEDVGMPGPGPGPEPGPEPPIRDDVLTCDEYSKEIFDEFDYNSDGDISKEELQIEEEISTEEFEEIDVNLDGVIDQMELKSVMCNCENELYLTFSQLGETSVEYLSGVSWKNDYDFFEMDYDNDMYIDYREMEDYAEECETTYNPFDRDGDGTPDDEDAFPDDPDEDTDTDGDGIGDNADIIASVDNDIIWVSASVLGLILVTVLGILFVRSRRGSEYAWEEYQKDRMSEAMLTQMVNPTSTGAPSNEYVPPALDLGPPVENVPEEMTVSDLYD